MRFHANFLIVLAAAFLYAIVPSTNNAQTIVIDPHSSGRVFDGIGAISGGGGNSRLLFDYAEPYRGQILDYLFKPNYGASLQILKVEIGADMDSTDGAESSHMHTAADENYFRGYEWWLMEEAKKRNPKIKLAALAWGAPAWVGKHEYWSDDMIAYTIMWLRHAKTDHGLTIDYIGGRNERGYNLDWYKKFKPALTAAGFGSVQVVASDDWQKVISWNMSREMAKFPDVNAVVDIVGVHGPGWAGYPPAEALGLGKPLWDSESHYDEKFPYNEVARNINRNYVAGKVTATIYWPVVSAMYENLPYGSVGMIKSNEPWSGHYTITPSMWVMAQTTQFAQSGWRYMDSASGYIAGDATGEHGSYVALQSPEGKEFSVIVETAGYFDIAGPDGKDPKDPQTHQSKETLTLEFKVAGFKQKTLHVWSTKLDSKDAADWFMRRPDLAVVHGGFSLVAEPGYVYSVTTTDGQRKGDAVAPPASAFPLPFADNFDEYPAGKLAKYFSDLYGGFETSACKDGRAGGCLSQVVPAEPTSWKRSSNRPFTELGGLDWADYRVSSDVLFEQPGEVDLIGRLSGMSDPDIPNSYVLRVSDVGEWRIIKTSASRENKDEMEKPMVLTSGKVGSLGVGAWHKVAMVFAGKAIAAYIDGVKVGEVDDTSYAKGMVGIGTVGYAAAQFDNFRVE